MQFPDYALPWIIRSNSSDHAVGAVLFQEFTDSEDTNIHQLIIAVASHKYSGAAVNWDTIKKEAYALYYAVTQFGYYLRGKPLLLETDQRNLVWIETSQLPIVVRWRVLPQSYVFTVKHIRSSFIITNTDPILFNRGLLDTGAQGSNFISCEVYNRLPSTITDLSRSIDRIVRLGDARSLSIEHEIPLTVGVLDSANNIHQHCLWHSVLDVLSHDIIIGLVDLIGPFYDLFADSVTKSCELSITNDLETHLRDLTVEIQVLHSQCNPQDIERATRSLQHQNATYHQRKNKICDSGSTQIELLALQNGTTTDIPTHPRLGYVFADNRVEVRYDILSALLNNHYRNFSE